MISVLTIFADLSRQASDDCQPEQTQNRQRGEDGAEDGEHLL
jgi:hypothetical protein